MFAAAIFAVHPVNVESVAWITQLKNTLSLTLALISALFYLLYEQKGGRWRYVLAIGVFLLSTLAKGMALTLPVVLLACDWWQTRADNAARPAARPAVLPDRGAHGRHGDIHAASPGVVVRSDGPAQPNCRCGLRRVVLLLETDLAAQPDLCLPALEHRRAEPAVLSARRCCWRSFSSGHGGDAVRGAGRW